MTKIINFYGGPGSGKSTLMADVFAELKWEDINTEIVPEFAKDLIWEKRSETLADQVYIFAKQYHRIYRLLDQVDYIITDAPLLLNLYYGKTESEFFKNFVVDRYQSLDNIDIFVNRVKKYNPIGRLQTEEEANLIDKEIMKMLTKYSKETFIVDGTKDSVPEIVRIILNDN